MYLGAWNQKSAKIVEKTGFMSLSVITQHFQGGRQQMSSIKDPVKRSFLNKNIIFTDINLTSSITALGENT